MTLIKRFWHFWKNNLFKKFDLNWPFVPIYWNQCKNVWYKDINFFQSDGNITFCVIYSQEFKCDKGFKCDRKIFKIFCKFFFILHFSLDTKTLTINEVYQYVKYLIIKINRYIILAKNWDFSIFSIAEDEKIKSKYYIILIIICKLNHIYNFYIYHCIINKNKITTVYINFFEKNQNFDLWCTFKIKWKNL